MDYSNISSFMQNIVIVLVSLLLGSLGAWIIEKTGYKFGILDVPNHRSSHVKKVPKGGGIGILIAFVVSSVCLDISQALWIPALILSGISFLGDKIELSIKFRLIIQFACSLIFLINLFYFTQVHLLAGFLVLPFSIFIVGTSNFYNFMDGIDGIAGITGIVGFVLIACFGFLTDADSNYIVLALSIAFACTGFLLFNFPKAKVFMGDIGSVLLGFIFACLIVVLSRTFLEFVCLSGFLFPFYADEFITIFTRLKNGDSLKNPHRKHIYQLLANEYRVEHWKISTSYGMIQLFIGIMIIFLREFGYIPVILLLVLCFSIFSVFSFMIRQKL